MKRPQGLLLAILLVAPSAAPAQPPLANPPGQDMPAPSPADDAYKAPRISEAYRDALARLPDMNGYWQGDRVNRLGLCFDCAHFFVQPDPAAPGDIGRLPTFPAGSKDIALPYNDEYRKVYDDTIAKAVRGGDTDPDNCIRPHQTADAMGTGFGPIEIVMTPTELRMSWEWLNATRRIYTDGRPHPAGDDLWPTYMGHSTGRWEGDTLVVDTIGMFAGFYDQTGAPHSDKLHIIERIRLIAKDKLEVVLTVDDPVMLTRPYTVRRTWTRIPLPVNALLGSYCSDFRDSNSAEPASLIH